MSRWSDIEQRLDELERIVFYITIDETLPERFRILEERFDEFLATKPKGADPELRERLKNLLQDVSQVDDTVTDLLRRLDRIEKHTGLGPKCCILGDTDEL